MYVKLHKSQNGDVLAICDENLLGKTLKDEKYQVKISEHFYKGEKMNSTKIKPLLKQATNVNMMGGEAVNLGIKLGIITKENIKLIAGVPHAQAYT